MAVLVSDTIGQERLIFGSQPASPAVRQYWKALSASYQSGLRASGLDVQTIVRPEVYQTPVAHDVLGVRAGDWHLAIKPIEHLRPFHDVPNVFVCNWPYAELSSSMLGGVPFRDQVRLLRMADAVICCTNFSADVLCDAGVENVVVLPPYIAGDRGNREVVRSAGVQRFLVNATARHLGPVLKGFEQALGQRDDLVLMVDPGADRVCGEAGHTLGDRLVLAKDGLSSADFVLCGIASCGLPLTMVRAMLDGVPLIAPAEGVCAALAPPGATVPLATEPAAGSAEDEPIAAYMRLTWPQPTAEGVRDAILAAASLDADARNRMAATARERAERLFGMDAFQFGLGRLVARLR